MKKLAMFLVTMSLAAGAGRCTAAELTPDVRGVEATSQAARTAEEAGDQARMNREYVKAAVSYERALRFDPKNSQLWNKLGIVDLKLDDRRGAHKSFATAIKFDPRNALALNNLGALELLDHRYKIATHYLKQALALDESNASAHLNLAEAWMGQTQVDRAMTEYSRALELDPDILDSSNDGVLAQVRTPEQEARIDFLIARAYAERGNLDGALDYLSRAKTRHYPNLSEVYSEKEFASLWTDPRLQQLVKK
ncbi:MAG: tetratricopeptide repeat protein [Terracidiphilus sp.]